MNIQTQIGQWHRNLYPICPNERLAKKYWEESLECRLALADGADWPQEAADVVIVLMSLCDRNNVDLMAEVARKFEIVKARGSSQIQRDLERGV